MNFINKKFLLVILVLVLGLFLGFVFGVFYSNHRLKVALFESRAISAYPGSSSSNLSGPSHITGGDTGYVDTGDGPGPGRAIGTPVPEPSIVPGIKNENLCRYYKSLYNTLVDLARDLKASDNLYRKLFEEKDPVTIKWFKDLLTNYCQNVVFKLEPKPDFCSQINSVVSDPDKYRWITQPVYIQFTLLDALDKSFDTEEGGLHSLCAQFPDNIPGKAPSLSPPQSPSQSRRSPR